MNQAIQFIDRLEYHAQQQHIIFYAQVSGMLVECVIASEALSISNNQQAHMHFEHHRFDYEELAEQLIIDESYNLEGKIDISPMI
ncbi:DUF1488 domain-containing protein [Pseudoalteromonas sp. MMG010]|uniref:DUF1488 domain-containing protein n=1 Tax=Pseudoalteromonas sp. MMG010 TaxID=2822685 RepID=UPI001B3A48D9|nr:DUF1488 domain-containing protein [Pseudoalteromonas sp. MMG010]MBQ4834597.1 DUF1488 domain-containing protein [Pseudoalteromonas sp. MMG010]